MSERRVDFDQHLAHVSRLGGNGDDGGSGLYSMLSLWRSAYFHNPRVENREYCVFFFRTVREFLTFVQLFLFNNEMIWGVVSPLLHGQSFYKATHTKKVNEEIVDKKKVYCE